MQNKLLQFVLSAALTSAMAALLPKDASAAPVVTDTYYDQTIESGCTDNTTACELTFTKVPAKRVFYITRVACDLRTSEKLIFASLQVVESGSTASLTRYAPLKMTEGPVVTYQATFIDVQPGMRFEAGTKPRIRLQTQDASLWFVRCQLVGRVATE